MESHPGRESWPSPQTKVSDDARPYFPQRRLSVLIRTVAESPTLRDLTASRVLTTNTMLNPLTSQSGSKSNQRRGFLRPGRSPGQRCPALCRVCSHQIEKRRRSPRGRQRRSRTGHRGMRRLCGLDCSCQRCYRTDAARLDAPEGVCGNWRQIGTDKSHSRQCPSSDVVMIPTSLAVRTSQLLDAAGEPSHSYQVFSGLA